MYHILFLSTSELGAALTPSVTSQLPRTVFKLLYFQAPPYCPGPTGSSLRTCLRVFSPFGPGILNLTCPVLKGGNWERTHLGSASSVRQQEPAPAPHESLGHKRTHQPFLSCLIASLGLSLPSQESWCLTWTRKTIKRLWSPFYWTHLFLRLPGDWGKGCSIPQVGRRGSVKNAPGWGKGAW